MTHSEQRAMVKELRDYTSAMNRDDYEVFAVMLQRHKDDEDFDLPTQKKLDDLHIKYVRKKSRKDLEEAWKKMTGGAG